MIHNKTPATGHQIIDANDSIIDFIEKVVALILDGICSCINASSKGIYTSSIRFHITNTAITTKGILIIHIKINKIHNKTIIQARIFSFL